MRKIGCDTMSKILIKMPMKPHRQKVLTEAGEEKRLQQLANQMAARELRAAGGDVQGDQFTTARDALMRDMVANPEAHNIKFMNERVPFEGQTLGESLSMPDVAGERAAIDSEFAGEDDGIFSGSGTKDDPFVTDNRDEEEPKKEKEFNPDKEAEHMRNIMTSRNVIMRDAWSVLKQSW